jgi:two-component system, LytTR family, sensor kinase
VQPVLIKFLMVYLRIMIGKPLLKRMIHTATLSSPILAVYGVTPVYLFNPVTFETSMKVFGFLLMLTFIFWLINIYVLNKTHNKEPWKRYLLSYFLTMSLQAIFFSIAPKDREVQFENKYSFIYPLLFILAINTIIIIISNSMLLSQKKQDAERQIEQLTLSNLEAQKQVLMQQLQPHFLFNTLSVLKSLIRESPDEAENYAIKLSDFLRYSVQVHNTTLVTLKEELTFTKDYIELQKVRFEKSLIISMSIPEHVHQLLLPAYALQALVENAIKHNAFTEKKPLSIRIQCTGEEISVINNKTPISVDKPSGTGLRNLNARYKIIAGKEIEIQDRINEFCVTVKLLPN